MIIDLTQVEPVRVALVVSRRLFREVLRVACERDARLDVVAVVADIDAIPDVVRRHPGVVVVIDVTTGPSDLALLGALTAALPEQRFVALVGDEPGAVAMALEAGAHGSIAIGEPLDELVPAIVAVFQGEVAVSGPPLTRLVRSLVAIPEARDPRSEFLTARERDILRLLAAGLTTAQLAAELGISVHTARTHVQSVLTKLNVHSRLEAAAYAVAHGLA